MRGSVGARRWYTSTGMSSTRREHGVHGARPTAAALRCVLLSPDGTTPPHELTDSLKNRDAEVVRAGSEYEALAALVRAHGDPTADVLLLVEPDEHSERCIELARAVQVYAPTVRIWRHQLNATPSLAAYILPAEPSESEQVEAVRAGLRAAETPYERAARDSAQPSLRLVGDDDHAEEPTEAVDTPIDDPTESDGLLSADEIEMLMDPRFDPKPRRGSDSR